jgi:LysM repeat protein
MPFRGTTGKGMFTVHNKDVILHLSIAVLSFAFLFFLPKTLYGKKKSCEKKSDMYRQNSSYEPYEHYLPCKNGVNTKGKKVTTGHKTSHISSKQSSKRNFYVNKANTVSYTVHKGDTLTSIAKKFHISIYSIKSLNKLHRKNSLTKGMVLKIPSPNCPLSAEKTKKDQFYDKIIEKNKPLFIWPVHPIIEYKHDGINGVKPIGIIITGKPGSRVISSSSGIVKKIGTMRGFGKYIVINHAGRYSTVYANLGDILVSEGDSINIGCVIGKINSSDRRLHFQIDLQGKPENPLQYLPKNI